MARAMSPARRTSTRSAKMSECLLVRSDVALPKSRRAWTVADERRARRRARMDRARRAAVRLVSRHRATGRGIGVDRAHTDAAGAAAAAVRATHEFAARAAVARRGRAVLLLPWGGCGVDHARGARAGSP